MKIQAKNLKEGMTIIDGVWQMKVQSIRHDKQKNGIKLIIPKGFTSRKNSKNNRKRLGEFSYQNIKTERFYKELTFINIIGV